MLTALLLALTTQAPIVIAPGPARPVVVVLDGQAYQITTTPFSGPMPPDPPSPPPPKPPEPPVPLPVAGVLWVSLVVQDSDVAQAKLRTHADVRAVAKPGEVQLRTYTHDDPALAAVKLTPYVAQHGTPLLVVQDAAGKVLSTIKPTDAASVVAEVRRFKP